MSSLQSEPLKTLCETLDSAHDAIADLCRPGKSLRVDCRYQAKFMLAVSSLRVASAEIAEYLSYALRHSTDEDVKVRLDSFSGWNATAEGASTYIAKMAKVLLAYDQHIHPAPDEQAETGIKEETEEDKKLLRTSFCKVAKEQSINLSAIYTALSRIISEDGNILAEWRSERRKQQLERELRLGL